MMDNRQYEECIMDLNRRAIDLSTQLAEARNKLDSQYDLVEWITEFIPWSQSTFGGGPRTVSICRHIEKELKEIQEKPKDLYEWIDVIILACDGAWQTGHTPTEIAAALWEKQRINTLRRWPVNTDPDKPTEHIRD